MEGKEDKEATPLDNLFQANLLNKNLVQIKGETTLTEKVIGLYFSASWCPPCQEFTPRLVDMYTEIVGKRKLPLEIVFISCDRTEDEMMEYMTTSHGEWWAVPFGNDIIKELREHYNINVVPKLVVLKPNGDIITNKGRKEVTDRGVAAFRSWFDSAEITLASSSKINIFDSSVFDEHEPKEK